MNKDAGCEVSKVRRMERRRQCFVGRCPDLFDGGVHGRDEAKVYMRLCAVSGKFVVRVEPSVHRRLVLKAKAEGESLNTFASKALRRA